MKHKQALCAVISMAVGCVGACQSEDEGEQAALQALLRDAPLTQLPPSAAANRGEPDRVANPGHRGHVVLPSTNPLGLWDFEDCSPFQTNLFDESLHNNIAFRSVGVACTGGIAGSQGVAIAAPEDIVYVPDQPSFRFEGGLTVAGWFNPTTTGGTRTLFRKRDKGTSSFALLLHARKFELVVSFGEGRAISLTAPAKARVGVFQHVAATYDGATARLYVDGVEANHLDVAGSIPPGPGPLLIGNDGSERRFAGAIDSALFATHALTADEIQALTCLATEPPTMVATPTEVTTTPGVPATFDIALTNHSVPACGPIQFALMTTAGDGPLALDPPLFHPISSAPVAGGATTHMTLTATPFDLGTSLALQFQVNEPVTGFSETGFAQVTAIEPAGCHVSTARELMIKRPAVVDDPVRTVFDAASSDPRNGVWTFKHLMETLAATPEDAPAMVEAMLTSFTVDQTINGFLVAARPGMPHLVLDTWPRTADGALDLSRAPVRLQAIVNRVDLRNLGNGDAGEGRFVFAFIPAEFPDSTLDAFLIFEYKLPAASEADVLDWATAFHALGALPIGEDYNAALQAITERFVARGARPGHPNGSAINAVRSNEFAFRATKHGGWELRQFELSAVSGRLEPALLALTPDASVNGTTALASYINANQAAILAETHTVPAVLDGQPFQAGAVLNVLGAWVAPGVDPEARHHFSLNTCNGCHSPAETGVQFSQLRSRQAGGEAALSPFLTGVTISDPMTGQPRSFNDLGRRNVDLAGIVCPDPQVAATARSAALRKGISRVH
jgi:hypothetical protein